MMEALGEEESGREDMPAERVIDARHYRIRRPPPPKIPLTHARGTATSKHRELE
jgi:hypothetical protein